MRKAPLIALLGAILAGCSPTPQDGQTIPAPAAVELPPAKYVFGAEMLESGAHYPIADGEISRHAPTQKYTFEQAELIIQEKLAQEKQFAALLYRWKRVDTETFRPIEDLVEVWALGWGKGATPIYWEPLARLESEEGKISIKETRIGEDWIIWHKNEKTPEGWEPDSSLWKWVRN